MNAFVQKLPRTYSVMKLYVRETPIQERKEMETMAEIPLFHGWNLIVRSAAKLTTNCLKLSGLSVSDGYG